MQSFDPTTGIWDSPQSSSDGTGRSQPDPIQPPDTVPPPQVPGVNPYLGQGTNVPTSPGAQAPQLPSQSKNKGGATSGQATETQPTTLGPGVATQTGTTTSTGTSGDATAQLQQLLAGGMNPQQAVNQINTQYGLQPGSSYAFEQGSNTVAVPGGGEYLEDSTGKWGPVYKTPETSGTGSATNPSGASLDPAVQAAMLKLINPTPMTASQINSSLPVESANLENQRAAQDQIAASAEQAAQGGELGTGGEQGMQRQLLEQAGQNTAQVAGQTALQQQQMQNQMTLGALQDQLGVFGINTQAGSQANQLGFDYTGLQAGQNDLALQLLLNGGVSPYGMGGYGSGSYY